MLDNKEVRDTSPKKLYSLLEDNLNIIYNKYYTIFMSKDDFKKSVYQEIYNSHLTYDGDKPYEVYIPNLFINRAKSHFKRILNKEGINNNHFKNYIDFYFCTINDDYKKAISALNKLSSTFENYNYKPSYEFICDLINNNIKVKNAIKIVFDHNKDLILNGNADELFDDYLVNMMEIYAYINNYEIDLSLDNDSLTYFSDPIYKQFYQDYKSIKPISQEEERKAFLTLKYSDEDSIEYKESLEKIVNNNLKYVINYVKKYRMLGLDINDLIQEGNLGLISAAKKFDVEKGFKFRSYAYIWIRQSISRALEEKLRLIRLPSYAYRKLIAYKKEVKSIEDRFNREVTDSEIESILGYSKEEINNYKKLMQIPISLNEIKNDENNSDMKSLVSDIDLDEVENKELNEELKAYVSNMIVKIYKPNAQYVMNKRFGLDDGKIMTLEEIGKNLNLTRQRVHQIESESIEKIKNNEKMMDYLKHFVNYDADDGIIKTEQIPFKFIYNNSNTEKYLNKKPIVVTPEQVDIINKKIERTTNGTVDSIDDDYESVEFLNNPTFRRILSKFDAEDATIIKLKLGLVNGKPYSDDFITTHFDVDEKDISILTEKALLRYRLMIDDSDNKTILDNTIKKLNLNINK